MQWCRKQITSGVGARLNRNLDKQKKIKRKKRIKRIMVIFFLGGGGVNMTNNGNKQNSIIPNS